MDTAAVPGLLPWTLLLAVLACCLAIDFGLASGRHRAIGVREAAGWNVFWIGLALALAAVVYRTYGSTPATEYLTGYVVERALSIDNIFVFVVIFKYFAVPPERQTRVLFWGILGALLMRAAFIVAGAAVATHIHAVLYLFGAFLIYTGISLAAKGSQSAPDPDRNIVVRLTARMIPIDVSDRTDRLFLRTRGRVHGTPLLVVLLVVASTDFVFALDSLPAILGITRDPWILFASNAFAVLGMRALYSLLAAVLPKFRFLHYGLALILSFIGARMLLERWVSVSTLATLLFVPATVAVAVAASLLAPEGGGTDEGV